MCHQFDKPFFFDSSLFAKLIPPLFLMSSCSPRSSVGREAACRWKANKHHLRVASCSEQHPQGQRIRGHNQEFIYSVSRGNHLLEFETAKKSSSRSLC
ncbi:MAG: hypothetical protein J3Q66DRAFT_434215 [Benniella sp.]|nr:MAG: hypothetical protein J3Q66DRAFT_434215 [Benniella sp.]